MDAQPQPQPEPEIDDVIRKQPQLHDDDGLEPYDMESKSATPGRSQPRLSSPGPQPPLATEPSGGRRPSEVQPPKPSPSPGPGQADKSQPPGDGSLDPKPKPEPQAPDDRNDEPEEQISWLHVCIFLVDRCLRYGVVGYLYALVGLAVGLVGFVANIFTCIIGAFCRECRGHGGKINCWKWGFVLMHKGYHEIAPRACYKLENSSQHDWCEFYCSCGYSIDEYMMSTCKQCDLGSEN